MAQALEISGGDMKSASKEMAGTDSSKIGHNDLDPACDDFAGSRD
ncbi:hypothetical protein GCM10010277_85440 [Streptomyces longisporoflavus]|nr:hypothetical protein GCM10010277_85440 [Streptomyces longisporoflavus]